MKKALGVVTILALLLSLLTSCSSPKSAFLANLKHFASKPNFSTKMTFQIKELEGQFKTKDARLWKNSVFVYQTSLNRKTNKSYNTYEWNVKNPTAHQLKFHTLQNFNTGKIYFPAKDLYTNQADYDFFFNKETQKIANDVLPKNKTIKNKYFDVYEALQNITGQTVDTNMVSKQAKEVANIEDKIMINFYKYFNKIDKKRFTSKKNAVILQLNKQDIRSLIRLNIHSLRNNNDLINLIIENNNVTKQKATQLIKQRITKINNWLDSFVKNDANKWNTTITLIGNKKEQLKKIFIKTDYQTAKDKLSYTMEAEFNQYKQIPSIPKRSARVSKEDLDKAISDVIMSYMNR